jgi:hypothetical protein
MSKRTASGAQPEPTNRPDQADRDGFPIPGPGADVLFELSVETSPMGTTKVSILGRGLIHGLWLPPCLVGAVVRLLGASTAVAVSALGVVFVVCAAFVGYQLKARAVRTIRPARSVRVIDAREIDTIASPRPAEDPGG